MKKLFLLACAASMAFMASAEIRVLSNVKLGEGYLPKFADSETVTFLKSQNASYVELEQEDAQIRVDNEELCLNLYQNGTKTVLTPHGSDVNYVWSSLSPNKKYILFNTEYTR